MNMRRVGGAAVGGALIVTLAVWPPAIGRSGDLAPGCQGTAGMSARTSMTGMTGMTGMTIGSEAEYLAEMTAHHREAVVAARELERSERPRMRELGASIVAGQTAEIERMQDWLRVWHPGTPPAAGYRPMMRDLSALTGDALDAAFLQDMIPHHMMAVMMSQGLLRRDLAEHDEVAELAATVRDDQRAEIRRMRGWLDEVTDTAGGSIPRHHLGGRTHR